jgi:hypothetical protein
LEKQNESKVQEGSRLNAIMIEMERLKFLLLEKDRKIQELEREKNAVNDTILKI